MLKKLFCAGAALAALSALVFWLRREHDGRWAI